MNTFNEARKIGSAHIEQGKHFGASNPHAFALGATESTLGFLLHHIKFEYGEEAAQKALEYIK